MDNFSINHFNGVILDFDGTMCFLFRDYDLSGIVEKMIFELSVLGIDISDINDPFDAFDMISCQSIEDTMKSQALAIADKLLVEAECEAVKHCKTVPGLWHFISELKKRQIPLGIATNNGEECVRLFLKIHKMNDYISINGRIGKHPELLKPNPWSIIKTAREMTVDLSKILFIGDTPQDWETAQNARCGFIGIAPTERKKSRFDGVFYDNPLLSNYYDIF